MVVDAGTCCGDLAARRFSSAHCACSRIRSNVACSNTWLSAPPSRTRSTKPAVCQIFTSVCGSVAA